MKLSSASMHYDLSFSEIEAMETIQVASFTLIFVDVSFFLGISLKI